MSPEYPKQILVGKLCPSRRRAALLLPLIVSGFEIVSPETDTVIILIAERKLIASRRIFRYGDEGSAENSAVTAGYDHGVFCARLACDRPT